MERQVMFMFTFKGAPISNLILPSVNVTFISTKIGVVSYIQKPLLDFLFIKYFYTHSPRKPFDAHWCSSACSMHARQLIS